MISKSRLDRVGKQICLTAEKSIDYSTPDYSIIDDWRQAHLEPLTEVTLKIQEWLSGLSESISVSQRLKRKPQIVSKLKRSKSIRLSQMQDVGGLRAIFETNDDIDEAVRLIKDKAKRKYVVIKKLADYRENGRQESGYRALHMIFERNGYSIEMQLRSLVQHAWAEEVERASIICKSPLKEGEGPMGVKEYFKLTSNLLHKHDHGYPINRENIREVEQYRELIRSIIDKDRIHLLDGFSKNEKIIRGLQEKEKRILTKGGMNNWLFIYDWKQGLFTNWYALPQKPQEAIALYSSNENDWTQIGSYEVVMFGSKSVMNLSKTHSHYFGVNNFDAYLKEVGVSVKNIGDINNLSRSSIMILKRLYDEDLWGSVSSFPFRALKIKVCENIPNWRIYLDELYLKDYIIGGKRSEGIAALNSVRKEAIEKILKGSFGLKESRSSFNS